MKTSNGLWINDYPKICGTMFCHSDHHYIQLHKYYDIVSKLETKPRMGYAMILHHTLTCAMCNRAPSPRKDIYLCIEREKGCITNAKEMEAFLCQEGYLKSNSKHLLNLASSSVWYSVFKNLLDVGLLVLSGGKVRSMFPIEGRFLPITYAYPAFLSRLKKDSNLKKSISQSLSQIPEKMAQELQSFDKDALIKEIVSLKTKDLKTHKDSELYKSLFDEISKKHPHKWGEDPSTIRESFLDKILEKIPQVSQVLESTAKKDDENKKPVCIDPNEIHLFESKVKPKDRIQKDTRVPLSAEGAAFFDVETDDLGVTERDIFGIPIDPADQTGSTDFIGKEKDLESIDQEDDPTDSHLLPEWPESPELLNSDINLKEFWK